MTTPAEQRAAAARAKSQAAQVLAQTGYWMCEQAVDDLWPWIEQYALTREREAVRRLEAAMEAELAERGYPGLITIIRARAKEEGA